MWQYIVYMFSLLFIYYVPLRVLIILQCFLTGCIVHKSVSVWKDEHVCFCSRCVLRQGCIDKMTFLQLQTVLFYFRLLNGPEWRLTGWNTNSFQFGCKYDLSFVAPVWMWSANYVNRGEWAAVQLPAVTGGRAGAWMSMIFCLTAPLNFNHNNISIS